MTESEARKALMDSEHVKYAVFQRNGNDYIRFPEALYLSGSVVDLGSLIRISAAPRKLVQKAANEIADFVIESALAMEKGLTSHVIDQMTVDLKPHTGFSALRVIAILWLDAMLVQSHLVQNGVSDSNGKRINPLPREDEIDASYVLKTWRVILNVNWRSIFEKAIDALEIIDEFNTPTTVKALIPLIKATRMIESRQIINHLQIGAELFPLVIDDRKEVAAFYTTPATAELLSTLVIRKDDPHDWSNPEVFKNLKIADLACGTGTLLRAAYHRVERLLEINGCTETDLSLAHRLAMEEGIIGADISPIASHLSNSGMALMGRGEPYTTTHIGWVRVGNAGHDQDRIYRTGSLELLGSHGVDDLFDTRDYGETSTGDDDTNREPLQVPHGTIDYVLMNPPYTRTNGQQAAFQVDGFTKQDQHECQKRWGKLLRGNKASPPVPASKVAGMAASFLCLAERKLRFDGGRMGFVLPLTAAFADSWTETRDMVVRNFDEIVAITQALHMEEASMSADTGMGEMLLVATKRRRSQDQAYARVRCITLKRMPIRTGEAIEFASAIQSALEKGMDGYGIMIGNEEVGKVVEFPVNDGEPWSHLGTVNPDLARSSIALSQGRLCDLQGAQIGSSMLMTTTGHIFQVGPAEDVIGHLTTSAAARGAFEMFSIQNKSELNGSNRSLWKADAKCQTTMQLEPTHRGVTRDLSTASRIADKQGTIHYSQGMRWTSQTLLVAMTQQPVFGGRAWRTLIHPDKRVLAAFAMWANSTLGLVVHWTRGVRTQNGRSQIRTKATAKIPCPDLTSLSDEKLNSVFEKFEVLKHRTLQPACCAHIDEVREEIDTAVVELLGLPCDEALNTIADIRNAWCFEPSVHGGNRRALSYLN